MSDSSTARMPGAADGDPPAATSSSLEQADGANDDLEPRGEQGDPDDAA
jgi:hypothetical protein